MSLPTDARDVARHSGALNQKFSSRICAILERKLAESQAKRAAEPSIEATRESIVRDAEAIAAAHTARARACTDPKLAKEHLDAALAAMKLASVQKGDDGAAEGVTIEIHEAPDAPPVTDGDPPGVSAEPAADAGSAPVH